MQSPDLTAVRSLADFIAEIPAEARGVRLLADRAIGYISSFGWCGAVLEYYVGIGVANVIGVFLVHVEPAQSGVDDWLWVVVGDLPPAYLVVDDNPTPTEALESYIVEMRKWVDAVRSGAALDDVIPVNAAPTTEFAEMLAARLDYLSSVLLPEIRGDLGA